MKLLEFNNWTDVQTQQIVVLPRLEEHGALVSSPGSASPLALHKINETNVYDWSLEDILNSLKEQEPLRLHVSEDDDNSASTAEKNEILVVEEDESGEEKKDCDDSSLLSKATTITLPFSPMSELSSWTKRVVSETSKQVNEYKQQQLQKQLPGVLSLFLQSNTGAFLSLQQSSAHEITNTSLLILRKSATEPAGNDVIDSCQWYAKANDEWRILPGATHMAFQPSADLAGHFLRCVVQMADSSTLTCETETKIQMVPTLFQGIRQTTQKTTGYSSVCKVKNATFRFSITSTESGCALRVEQVLADHSTHLIHEQLTGVRALLASYATPKDFQLHLPLSEDKGDNHSLLYELADQKGIVSCQALNRLGRESFLIAFGIANYKGEASSCQPSMLLYPAAVDRRLLAPPLHGTLGTNQEPSSTTKAASDETKCSTTPPRSPIPSTTSFITPPRSSIPPIPLQRSTSLDTRADSPNEQTQQQLVELQRQNAELQKQNKQWQNEKAVLQAAVDARENKLEHAQQEIAQMRIQLEEQEKSESERQDRRILELQSAVEQTRKELQEKDSLIATMQTECKELEDKYQQGQTVVEAHQQEHAALTMKLQKLKAERCHFKQKNESLQKEIAAICKNGRTIRQVEKLIADDAARQQEVALLRQQKKEALTELEHYRTAYQEAKHAQKMAGLDLDVTRLLERNAELERLVGELTEFVEAKESQLETVKRVNEALQAEIHSLAKAHMSNNDI
jgi:hypothetical protein